MQSLRPHTSTGLPSIPWTSLCGIVHGEAAIQDSERALPVRANSSYEGSASGHAVMDVLGAGCTQTYRFFQSEYSPPPLECCLLLPTTISLSSNSLWLREQPHPWTLPSSLGIVYTSEVPSQLQSSQWYPLRPCCISTHFPSSSAQPFTISPLQLLLSSAFPIYSCLLLANIDLSACFPENLLNYCLCGGYYAMSSLYTYHLSNLTQ